MKPFYGAVLAAALLTAFAADMASAQKSPLTEKLNAYVGCINRLSERSYDSRSRYFSWAAKSGPTGKEDAKNPDVAAITQALNEYEETIKAAEQASGAGGAPKIGSFFMSNAKSYLVTAKQLMRRIRDKVPYSSGDKMMLSNAGSGWMVEGSPPRLLRDYNQLVESYNRSANI